MEFVIAYFLPPDGAAYEKYEMQRIDFNEAKLRFPKQWFLELPTGAESVDKMPPKLDIAAEIASHAAQPAASPPIAKRRAVGGLNPI